jgi:hypothetical protein
MTLKTTTQMKIKQIWDDLGNDKSTTTGLLFRRYSSAVLPSVYIAVKKPENFLCLYISINDKLEINISNLSNLQEIQVDLLPSQYETDRNILIFQLKNQLHEDIFAVLCEDMIARITNEIDDKIVIREVLNRFEKWKSLFNKVSLQGLQPEEQRGLFGELYFLRNFLRYNQNFLSVIDTWVGTEKQIRDFQCSTWAVEVKTTQGNNHQKIQINGERQLDISNLEHLFLYHISLEQQQNSGESLNEIVDSVIEILKNDTISLYRFKSKLYEVGYFDLQRNLYDLTGYHIRQDSYYKVEGDFPRIEEKDIRIGVGDVKYSIILSQCTSYEINETLLFDIIKP